MDVYGPSPPDLFRVDDLLDFSNDELFSPNSSTTDSDHLLHHHHHQHLHLHLPLSDNTSTTTTTTTDSYFNAPNPNFSSTDDLGVPSDDVAELEWLSNFVDDSFTDFPANSFAGTVNLRPDSAFQGRSRSKRCRSTGWSSSSIESNPQLIEKSKTDTRRRESSVSTSRDRSSSVDVARRCTHCASEKTPQWRTGPMGPKTLCNACGVRYKSGRLVPEYRPAASPTFVLTQHSNSHRKVLELRRQKELLHHQQQQQEQQMPMPMQQQQEQHMYGLHHFQVC